ncbi:MAG TPA: bacteriophage holin [Acidobacteriota bacterium]|nr:bacteriophage holin [Acidobacteriota bacterium]
MKLNVKALALTSSLLWGLAVFGCTWWMILFDGASAETTIIGRIYRGYSITPLGSLVGLIWGLVDGLICGAIFGWVYNLFVGRRTSTE